MQKSVVKMKKTLEPCLGQSSESCTQAQEVKAICQYGISSESTKNDLRADLSEKNESIPRTIQTKIKNIQRLKTCITEAHKTRTRIQSEIRSASNSIINQFRQKEKQLMDALDGVSENQLRLLSADMNQNKTDIQLATQKMVVIKKIISDTDLMELCPENFLSEPTEDEGKVVRLIRDVLVSQDTGNVKKGIKDLSFGQFDRTFQDLHDRSSRPKLLNTTSVALKNDFMGTSDVVDIIVLDVEGIKTIIVSHYYNKSVKSFYVRNGKSCHSEFYVDSPRDLTLLEENRVMVSTFNSCRIWILAVTPDLICLTNIHTKCGYLGLRALTPSMLVGCRGSTGQIDILDIEGEQLRVVMSGGTGDKGIHNRLCVTNNGNILVSNWKRKCLVCLTPQGETLWEHFPAEDGGFGRVSAVTTTRTGDILLADYDASRVIQLSESGRFVKDILVPEDGLAVPTALFLYNEIHLFVGGRGEVKEYLLP